MARRLAHSATAFLVPSGWFAPEVADVAGWFDPDLVPSTTSLSSESTPSAASWGVPSGTAAPGSVASASTPATASWSVPSATATPGSVEVAASPPSSTWASVEQAAAPGAVTSSSTPPSSTWAAPDAGVVSAAPSPAEGHLTDVIPPRLWFNYVDLEPQRRRVRASGILLASPELSGRAAVAVPDEEEALMAFLGLAA